MIWHCICSIVIGPCSHVTSVSSNQNLYWFTLHCVLCYVGFNRSVINLPRFNRNYFQTSVSLNDFISKYEQIGWTFVERVNQSYDCVDDDDDDDYSTLFSCDLLIGQKFLKIPNVNSIVGSGDRLANCFIYVEGIQFFHLVFILAYIGQVFFYFQIYLLFQVDGFLIWNYF